MALDTIRWLDITCTQGGADAFVQGSVSTDLVPEDGYVYKVNRVVADLVTNISAIAADSQIEWSMTRDTKTAVAAFNDSDTIIHNTISFALVTSGAAFFNGLFEYDFADRGVFLVEPTIYAQFDSTATTLTMTMLFRIYYSLVRATEIDILRIVNET